MEDFEFGKVTQADIGAIQARGFGMVNLGHTDDQQVVIFRWESVRNDVRSREAGRPVHERKMYVTIHPPGERLNIIDREVQESDKHRWPQQWNSFVNNRAHVPEGTPIALLFPVNPEVADMLRSLGIHTVELLSKLTPHAIETVGMGAQDWVNKAKRYLEQAQKGVDYHEIEKLRSEHAHEVNALKNQIGDLVMRLNSMQASIATLPSNMQAQMQTSGPQPVAVPHSPLPQTEAWAAPPEGFVSPEPDPQPIRRGPGRPPGSKNKEQ